MPEKPVLGYDYDVARWSDGSRDDDGRLIWHERYPSNDETPTARYVTLNLDPGGEGDYRNYRIHPDRPLDPYGSDDPDAYDFDDIAEKAFLDYGFEF